MTTLACVSVILLTSTEIWRSECMSCLWRQVICKYHCEEGGRFMEERLCLAPIALSPDQFVINMFQLY